MLDTVKDLIDEISNESEDFETLFSKYVMEMQDTNIDQEISYMLKHNVISVDMIDRSIHSISEDMVNWYGK